MQATTTTTTSELATTQPSAIELHGGNPIAGMLQAIVDKGVTPETAAAMEKLTDLYLRMEAENAKKAFAAAFAAMQLDLPRVVANKDVKNKDGSSRYYYADYEQIMDQVGPTLARHGFGVSFTIRVDAGPKDRVCAVCTLTHVGGHAKSNEFSVRVGQGPQGTSEAQADGAARSYARRGALCDALNVTIDKDSDARMEGSYLRPRVAAELEARVHAAGMDRAVFLELAGAESFEDIREGRLPVLENAIRMKERRPAKKRADLDLTTFDGFKAAMLELARRDRVGERDFGGAIGKVSIDHAKVKADGETGDKVRRMIYDAANNGAFDWITGTLPE